MRLRPADEAPDLLPFAWKNLLLSDESHNAIALLSLMSMRRNEDWCGSRSDILSVSMIPTLTQVTAGRGLSLNEYIALAQRHGFVGVEYSILDAARAVESNGFKAVAGWFEQAGVLPAVFDLPVEWRKDEAAFESDLARLSALAKLAQDLDCTRCTTWVLPAIDGPAEEYSARSIKRLGEAARVLEEQGLRLGLEFLGPQHFRPDPNKVWFYDIAGALEAVEQVEETHNLENVGLLVDCWHWYTSGGTLMDLASIPVEQIVHIHINDAPDISRAEQLDNVRLLPGASGVIDLTGFLKTLAALGCDGPVGVETFSEDLNALSPDEAAARAAASTFGALAKAGIEPVRLL